MSSGVVASQAEPVPSFSVIGIDPGLTGAIAWFKQGRFVWVEDMPVRARTVGKGNEVDAVALWDLLDRVVSDLRGEPFVTYIEVAQAMVRKNIDGTNRPQGLVSTFTTGDNFGTLRATVELHDLPIQYVYPAMWKRKLNLWGKDKSAARTWAMRRWPEARPRLQRVKDHGRADAVLIATHAVI